jgi:hypothetical protein
MHADARGNAVDRSPCALLAVWAVLLVAGCGPKQPATGEVSGVVTIEGMPVGGLIVHFEPQDGVRLGLPPAYGVTNESGRYRAMLRGQRPGATVGLNHVRITPAERDGAPPAEIHARYAGDYAFWFEVAPGANTFDIELKADPLKKVPVAR